MERDGPLRLVGVVMGSGGPCGAVNFPALHTRVSPYVKWIRSSSIIPGGSIKTHHCRRRAFVNRKGTKLRLSNPNFIKPFKPLAGKPITPLVQAKVTKAKVREAKVSKAKVSKAKVSKA